MDEPVPFFTVHLMLTAAGWEWRARMETWVAFVPKEPAGPDDNRVLFFEVIDNHVSPDDVERVQQILRDADG